MVLVERWRSGVRPTQLRRGRSDWPVFEIAGEFEDEIGVPVLHPVPVRCWYIQKKLGLNQPVQGYGRLLAEMV